MKKRNAKNSLTGHTYMVIPDSFYTHYKGGKYKVLHIADESTNEREGRKVVVYQSLERDAVHTRDLEQFEEMITWPDGIKRARFVRSEEIGTSST